MWIFFCIFVIMNDKDYEKEFYNSIHKRLLVAYSVNKLNECGIEVDSSNRNKIVHNYE